MDSLPAPLAAMDVNVLTSLMALLAAAQFAAGTLLVKRGLETMDAITGAVVSIGASIIPFALVAPFLISASDWLSPAVWIFAAIGVLRPSLSTTLAYEGTRRIGPTVASTFESTSPLFAVTGGVLLLGEHLTPAMAVGTLGVVCGAVILARRGKVTRNWPLWAVIFPLGASAIRSAAHVAARSGLLILPNVTLSGLVAYVVSFLVTLASGTLRPRQTHSRLKVQGFAWFFLVGLTNAGAIFALNTGLMIGAVSVVSPVTATYPLFTLLGSWIFYRQDPINRRTVLGVLLVVPSVILITLGR